MRIMKLGPEIVPPKIKGFWIRGSGLRISRRFNHLGREFEVESPGCMALCTLNLTP